MVYIFKCLQCTERTQVHTDTLHVIGQPPHHCGETMKRDYRAESVGATFKGGGWARSSK